MSRFAPISEFIDRRERVLLLHDDAMAADAAVTAPAHVAVHHLADEVARPGRPWQGVVLMVRDLAALRAAISVLKPIGGARNVAVWVDSADRIVSLTPPQRWQPVTAIQARLLPSGAAVTKVRLARAMPGHRVLQDLARCAVNTRAKGTGGIYVGHDGEDAAQHAVPAAMPLPDSESLTDGTPVVPPDVVLGRTERDQTVTPVTGRAPVAVSPRAHPVGPLDEAVLNPRGYCFAEHGIARVDKEGEFHSPDGTLLGAASERGEVSPALVNALRPYAGVEVEARHPETSLAGAAHAKLVASLAMAGVPVHGPGVEGSTDSLLGPRLQRALQSRPDLADALARDEYSVDIRRAALLEHSTRGWYASMAKLAGLPTTPWPTVSILLSSKRPHQLRFALRQVARQRDVHFELVLATHGYQVDASQVRSILGDIPALVIEHESDVLFGEVLASAARCASGAVLVKMDDDDWYGPDFLTDLLIARHHSGADLVGCTAEYVYLERLHQTIRRSDDSEREANFVAGGTMMLDAAFLADVGGFRPVRRYVDAQLLHAVRAAGGSIYRTHGLGYVMRRSPEGHTWSPGIDYFLDEGRLDQTWDGFQPSRHLMSDPLDEPRPVSE